HAARLASLRFPSLRRYRSRFFSLALRRRHGLPGSWTIPSRLCCVLRPRSVDSHLALEDGRRRGELLFPSAFARALRPDGASFRFVVAVLAASRCFVLSLLYRKARTPTTN